MCKWTFPKGNVKPGLTPRQGAEFEDFEEAGVMGNQHYLKALPLEGAQLLGEFLDHGKR